MKTMQPNLDFEIFDEEPNGQNDEFSTSNLCRDYNPRSSERIIACANWIIGAAKESGFKFANTEQLYEHSNYGAEQEQLEIMSYVVDGYVVSQAFELIDLHMHKTGTPVHLIGELTLIYQDFEDGGFTYICQEEQ